ncbi:MAG TPA: hypothetical protein PLI45_00195 [Candidatus Woesebacteria bacterium]|nr:hypothetical protein [Candidatus Woesebacteria bacterium]
MIKYRPANSWLYMVVSAMSFGLFLITSVFVDGSWPFAIPSVVFGVILFLSVVKCIDDLGLPRLPRESAYERQCLERWLRDEGYCLFRGSCKKLAKDAIEFRSAGDDHERSLIATSKILEYEFYRYQDYESIRMVWRADKPYAVSVYVK